MEILHQIGIKPFQIINGKNYQPQLVSRISEPSTVSGVMVAILPSMVCRCFFSLVVETKVMFAEEDLLPN